MAKARAKSKRNAPAKTPAAANARKYDPVVYTADQGDNPRLRYQHMVADQFTGTPERFSLAKAKAAASKPATPAAEPKK